jgi:two-component system NtrC family sensor kinase
LNNNTAPPRAARELTSLGRTDWGAASASSAASALDPRLGHVLLDNITARIAVVDRNQRYLYANREMLEFLRRPAEEVIGKPLEAVVGSAANAGYQPLRERLYAGESLRLEGWVDSPQRGMRYLKETFIPYGPPGQAIEMVAVFGRDLTDLMLREEELASKLSQLDTSEALKSAIVDHALAALVSTDEHGRIVEFNPAACAMFGRRRAQVLGLPVSEVVIPPRFRAAHEAGMRRMQVGGAARVMGKRLELHALRADGGEFPIEMVLWRTDVAGSAFYTASIADMSEMRDAALQIQRQREALRQSEKLSAMGSLLAGVAHELNNPLAIVLGRASLLEEKCDGQPELLADARRIREAAERCGRIVRTFLNMARSRPSQRGAVNLNDMVRAAADMLQYGLRSHGIELELALAPDLPTLTADGDQIGQIVMNLLVNAQQALAGAAGVRRVTVRTGLAPAGDGHEPRLLLHVQDNGPGVPAALGQRLFEPFFTTKPEGMGTGLGLAVSRAIAREHGGDLTLAPPQAHGGASFCLALPLGGAPQAGATPQAPSSLAGLAPKRLLVVDDEVELTELMRDMLQDAGFDVATAETGAVALEMLDTAPFSAIVSDLRMPDMDGAGLWREVAQRHPPLARRMLFVTGDTLSPGAREFLKTADCTSLEKPFSKADLLAKVAALLA